MERTNTEALRAWVNFLEDPSNVDLSNVDEENAKAIKEAIKILEEISNDEHERYLAGLREKYIRDQKAIKRAGYNDGVKEMTKAMTKSMLKQNIEIEKIVAITRAK